MGQPDNTLNGAPEGTAMFRLSASEALLGIYVVAGAGIAFVGLVVGVQLYQGQPIDWVLIAALGGAFGVFSIAWAALWWKAKRDRTVQVEVSEYGLHVPNLVEKRIPWRDIDGIDFRSFHHKGSRRQVFLVAKLNEPRLYPTKTGRWMRSFTRWWYGSPYVFGLEACPCGNHPVGP